MAAWRPLIISLGQLKELPVGDLLLAATLATGAGSDANFLRGDQTFTNWLNGPLGIGTASLTGRNLAVGAGLTGAGTAVSVFSFAGIKSDVTSAAYGFRSSLTTQAAAFTLPTLSHFSAIPGTFGAGSIVTAQYGFYANSTLTGATNNYGFYGEISAAAGRWNLYMQGTADNYFAGALGIGATSLTGYGLRIDKTMTGNTAVYGVAARGAIQSDVTTVAAYHYSIASTAAASFTLSELYHNLASQGTFGAGSTVTTQVGYRVDSTLIGATNNYGFSSNIAAATGRWNFYASGTADNYMAGALGIGTTSLTGFNVHVSRAFTGATTAYGIASGGAVQSDVNSSAQYFFTTAATQATAFTLSNLRHFYAAQGTFGLGSTVTSQFGFAVESSLVGGVNNYGFWSNLAAATGRWNFYASGTANNAFAGNVRIGSTVAPTVALDVTGSGAFSGVLTVGGANVSVAGHTHTASNISDFAEAVDDRVAAMVVQGANMTIAYDDVANTLTFAAATGGSPSFGNGTAASPALAPTTDANTGWYFDGADKILVAIGGAAFGGWNTSRSQFEVGAQIGFAPANQVLGSATATLNGYEQYVLQNFSAGTDASTDLVIGNDSASDTTNYLNLGLNSTGYTTNFFGSARDGYLYVTGASSGQGNLWIGTGQASTKVRILVGGGSASNVVCDFDSNGINLPAKTGAVTAPADGLNLFNRKRANRNTLRMLGPAGVESAVQPALFGSSVAMWMPGTGTTVSIAFATNWTARNSGTGAAQAHPTKASTNSMTSLNRATFGTGTTATGSSGIQSGATVAWRGNAAGLGGFFYYARFGVETYEAALQVMVGLSALNAALAGEPSVQNNSITMCKDSTDTNWQIVTRDGTTTNKINTGIACAAGAIFDFFIFAAPNSGSVAVQILNAVTGESLYENTNITSNLPVSTTFLYAHAQTRSTVGTTAKLLALNRIYVETDL